jgi:hypothetical protein
MQRGEPVFTQSCSSQFCEELAIPGSLYCELHKCFPASIITNSAYCESLHCSDNCASDSIYCLTHTCFPEKIVYKKAHEQNIMMNMFTNIKEQQKQIELRRRNGADWSRDFTGLSNTSFVPPKRNTIIYGKRVNDGKGYGDRYKDINRTCIRADCMATSLYMGYTCIRHSCLYCFESGIYTLNICLSHMPKELTSCVGIPDLCDDFQMKINCYLTKLSNNILYIIMNYIRSYILFTLPFSQR